MPILNRCSAHLKKIAQNARPATVRSYTSRNVETTAYTRDTVLKSTGGGTPGTLLPCRMCSMSGRSYKTICLPCGATIRRAGSRCVGRTDRGFSLDQPRDPRQRTISRSHPKRHTSGYYDLILFANRHGAKTKNLRQREELFERERGGEREVQFWEKCALACSGVGTPPHIWR